MIVKNNPPYIGKTVKVLNAENIMFQNILCVACYNPYEIFVDTIGWFYFNDRIVEFEWYEMSGNDEYEDI